MRLLSLTVRNYRVHKNLTVNFHPSRNLIGGPNECGKSTLAEAAHRALFLRAKTGGAIQKEMVSTHMGGDPEVALTFEAAGIHWELEKRFAGNKGSTRLTGNGLTTLMDDEADAKLSELLKTESGGRANASQLAATWSHLWVWQGSSGDNPASHASIHKDTLVQRLQKDGIAAVMQSANDQRVRERIAASYDEWFTSTGKPKSGSKPELARIQLTEAGETLKRAEQTSNRLEQAITDHSRAEKDIAAAEAVIPALRIQRSTAETKLIQVAELRRQEEIQLRTHQTVTARHEQLSKDDAKIRERLQQAATARITLAPAEEQQNQLAAEEQAARDLSQAAEISQRRAADALSQTRLHHDLATAFATAIDKAESHQRLVTRTAEADTILKDITTVRAGLAQLPPVNATDLTKLRKLDRDATQATTTLEAMATGIELLEARTTTIHLDGNPLVSGESHILTDVGELTIGDGTRLRIRPGGGNSLSESRMRAESAQTAFHEALARHTLRDLDHAATVFEQRQTFEQQIAQLETRWQALEGKTIATDLTHATAALEAANAEVHRRLAALDSTNAPTLPASSAAARTQLAASYENLASAETTEAAARRNTAQLRALLQTAADTLQTHRSHLANSRQALRDLETSITVLEETHGDEATRLTAIFQARESEQQAAGQLAATRQALAALAPDSLTADLDRFTLAITQQENRRREAEDLRITARAHLTLDGSSDPQADLSNALARCQDAREAHASAQRRAQAIEKLHQLFSSSREAIDQSLVQPLADRISGYLQALFGPGTSVRVNLSENGIEGLDLIRTGDPNFGFANLSGGAKEQVAAAVRLAMAEILASDHHGCLPILFDDAFAYTDPERVQSLQRMLNLAALRGLQVIVLTCAPDDYSAFGAQEHRLA